MAKMRNPRRDEFDEIFNLLNRVFQYEKIGCNPNHMREELEFFGTDNVLVMEEDGKIVSQVYIQPYKMYIYGTIMEGAEVREVATDEVYRGRGFASTLLIEAVRQMEERGYDISTLGGSRDRYLRWGWEHGGANRMYTISNRSIRYAGKYSNIKLSRYDPSDLAMKRSIIEAYERHEMHMIRPEVEHRLTYDVPMLSGMEVWIANSESNGFAYLVIRKSRDRATATLLEYGGDPETLILGLRRAFDEWNLREITVSSPDIYTEFTPRLERISEGWSVHPSRQMNIINLESCLRKLLPVAERCAVSILDSLLRPYSITLQIPDTMQIATVLFERGCGLIDGKGQEVLSLDRGGIVRLLFGQGKPNSALRLGRKMTSYLNLIFPLPFYEWPTDMR
jgi:predicted N-acetyltransferase YhbS